MSMRLVKLISSCVYSGFMSYLWDATAHYTAFLLKKMVSIATEGLVAHSLDKIEV